MINILLQQLQWREPLWLLLALQPILLFVLSNIARRRLTSYADKPLLPWLIRQAPVYSKSDYRSLLPAIRRTFYSLAWILFAVAAAGPRLAVEFLQDNSTPDLDLVVLVDMSESMQTTDVRPNRLRRAQQEILELLERLRKSRVAVVVFAAKAHLYVPLTHDHSALRYYVDLLDSIALPTEGSQLEEAVTLALEELADSAPKRKTIILISDGDFGVEDSYGEQYLKPLAARIRHAGVRLAILGMGTFEGDVIPLSGGGWLYHEGKPVISRLHETLLAQLAKQSDGFYSNAQDGDGDWAALYDSGIAADFSLPVASVDADKIIWDELYHWALVPGLILFMLAVLPDWIYPRRKAHISALLVVAFSLVLLPSGKAMASDAANRTANLSAAYKHYEQQNYQEAAKLFSMDSGYAGRLGEGASRYQQQDYDSAIELFTQAALSADNDNDIGVSLYNLANSYFQTGNYAAAVQVYEDALRYRGNHRPTRHNLSVSKALKALVEKRGRTELLATRTGSGPTQGLAQQSITIAENASATLDQSSDTAEKIPTPTLSNLTAEQVEILIQKGLQHIKVIGSSSSVQSSDVQWTQDTSVAKAVVTEFDGDASMVWRRLFEIEEGFPAPLEKTLAVPGVLPW